MYLLRFPTTPDVPTLVKELQQTPGVSFAEPNYIGTVAYAPSDPYYAQTAGHFAQVGMEDAWAVQPGGDSSVTVAVIDSGVDANHEDLTDAVAPDSWNFVDDNDSVFDDLAHGTRVAGIIGAEGNNGKGIAGAAFGCRILSLDVVDAEGYLTTARVIAALSYAVAHGAKLINMSIQFYAPSSLLQAACDAAAEQAVLVASAGNGNQGDSLVYPASYDSVLGVGATIHDATQRACFSNYNGTARIVDLVAPGQTIFTTIPGSLYDGLYTSGTSFAAPIVTGVAALLQSKYPAQSPAGIVQHLLNTAVPVGAWAGNGEVSAKHALETPLLPQLAVASVQVDDSTAIFSGNDHDGAWDKGETVDLTVTLTNSDGDATGITGTLSSADGDVTITTNSASWTAIATDGTQAATTKLRVEASPSAPAHSAAFSLAITANSGAYSITLPLALQIEAAQVVNPGNYFTLQTWTADKTWEVHGTQNFNAGLTVAAGAVIKVAPDGQLNIKGGVLTANGTATQPILFTSLYPPQQLPIPMVADIGPRTEAVNYAQYQHVCHVSIGTGSDSTGDGSAAYPWKTIPYALSRITDSSASNRYAVLVAQGTYGGSSVEMKDNVDMYGGFSAPSWERDVFRYGSTLDGEGTRTVVLVSWAITRLDGFRITRGYGSNGAGVRVQESSAAITNNILIGNSSGNGAVIRCDMDSSTLEVVGNLLVGNGSSSLVSVAPASCNMERNVVVGARYNGVSIGSHDITSKNNAICDCENALSCTGTIEDNVVFGNEGRTVFVSNYDSGVTGNLVFANTTDYGALEVVYEAYCNCRCNVVCGNTGGGGIVVTDSPAARIDSTIISGNTSEQIHGTATIDHCLVPGGYNGPGEANLDADPLFVDDDFTGVADRAVYDAGTVTTTLFDSNLNLVPGSLAGRGINIAGHWRLVKSNEPGSITVWAPVGDDSGGAPIKGPLPYEVARSFHLTDDSPCIDAGINDGTPFSDIDGDSRPLWGRSSLTVDIGADEYNPAHPARQFRRWGQINLQTAAPGSSVQYCTVENGRGVLNTADGSTFQDCVFRNNSGWGLDSPAGATIVSCTVLNNSLGGIKGSSSALLSCVAEHNSGAGLVASTLTNCAVIANASDGLSGGSASGSVAARNVGAGLNVIGLVSQCTAEDNRANGINGETQGCSSLNNDGVGISGSAENCQVMNNLGGGVAGAASGCRIANNTGVGVTGSSALVNCEISGNSEAAATGVNSVSGCTIVDNGAGLTVTGQVQSSYVSGNAGTGVSGGTVADCAVAGNSGQGLHAPGTVSNTWIVNKQGIGIDSPTGDILNCRISGNSSYGVRNLAPGRVMNYCTLYDNGGYDYYDNQNTASGFQWRDCRYNYWGPTTTAWMLANPFPSTNCPRIYDEFDSMLTNGWYVNYSEFQPNPAPPRRNNRLLGRLAEYGPDSNAPALLLDVTPNLNNAVNVGSASFTLVFSEAMNSTVPLMVTFGLGSPFTGHVVAASPGWVSATTWLGAFAVGTDTGDGLNTIRVANAQAEDGFLIPDDTLHQFTIDTDPGTGSNSGTAVPLGDHDMQVRWVPSPHLATLAGYHVEWSFFQDGAYMLAGSTLAGVTECLHHGLAAGTTYYYMVYEYDSDGNSQPLTAPFPGTTTGNTPTPTVTPTITPGGPTLTPSPTPTVYISGLPAANWGRYR